MPRQFLSHPDDDRVGIGVRGHQMVSQQADVPPRDPYLGLHVCGFRPSRRYAVGRAVEAHHFMDEPVHDWAARVKQTVAVRPLGIDRVERGQQVAEHEMEEMLSGAEGDSTVERQAQDFGHLWSYLAANRLM